MGFKRVNPFVFGAATLFWNWVDQKIQLKTSPKDFY